MRFEKRKYVSDELADIAWNRLLLQHGGVTDTEWRLVDPANTEPLEERNCAAYRSAARQYREVRELSRVVTFEDGERTQLRVTIKAPNRETAVYYAERNYGATHCQHSYDCCGHWYASAPTIRHAKRREWVIYASSYLNI